MEETEFLKLFAALRSQEVEVDLDVHPYARSADPTQLPILDRARQDAESRGERVAYVYRPEDTAKRGGWRLWYQAFGVNAKQAQQLMAAGASWLGPKEDRP